VSCNTAMSYLWDKNVNLSCTIRASPGVTALFWMLDSNGTVVSEGEVINEYWIINIVSNSSVVLCCFCVVVVVKKAVVLVTYCVHIC